ncbi:MAG: nucleotidyl transferase AbiEii/AbiGii toxin family protein [Bacteroidetes bacterium]|nr:nucleotidyl transferase AbiEii/AbiGii toxin family protein [Bacteroidota bacterium]
MIPRAFITEWQKNAPWRSNAQVEQDLIIERTLVEMFSDKMIRENLAFRGGTALHKIFFKPQVRYSEDIDLVQIKPGPIKPVLHRIRERLSFIGKTRTVKQNANNTTVIYRFQTQIEPIVQSRLKLEINCREHLNVLGWYSINHSLNSSYFQGESEIVSYKLEELLGTKLRALYQRKKGRDLFDLFYALSNSPLNTGEIIRCYREYMTFTNERPATAREFTLNMDAKMKDELFLGDITSLIRPEVKFDMNVAYELVKQELIDKI